MSLVLQKAIYQQLSTLDVPVYDVVPQDICPTYITIGEARLNGLDNTVSCRLEGTFDLLIWSTALGFEEVKELERQVLELLKQDALTKIDERIQHCRLERSQCQLRETANIIELAMQFYCVVSE